MFWISYEPSDRARALLADPRLLALIGFGQSTESLPADPRRIRVALSQLDGGPLHEVWMSSKPVTTGVEGRIAYGRTDDLIMGHLEVDERAHGGIGPAGRSAYDSVIAFTRVMGFPHFLRIWNYIPNINAEEDCLERYKSFCIGRQSAFDDAGLSKRSLPAATGVGSRQGDLLVYFLAAREPGDQIENPRQVSAFDYPPQYGPRSPAFSRAMAKRWGRERHLYISGTASIVGHESKHDDDVRLQLDETLDNIGELIDSANRKEDIGISTISDLSMLKVYVRDENDTDLIRERILKRVGAAVPSVYLGGDLCRRDLLLELEGLYTGH